MTVKKNKISSTFEVKSTSVKGQFKKLNLIAVKEETSQSKNVNGKTTQIKVHRFASVSPGNKLFIEPNHANRIYVLSSEDPNDKIQITPHFERTESFKFGQTTYKLILKEIVTLSELKDYEYLEGFHYKTSTAIVSDDSLKDSEKAKKHSGGRKSVLMCYIKSGASWQSAGYIELQMPLLMVKPRHILFQNPFSHPNRPVSWDSWKKETIKKYVNLIVRIARVVISPDLRGLGLAKLLIKTAKEYANERWQINGKRPLFIEISAEMLKYLDFVSSAGLRYVGETEGNLDRVHKDLTYMQRNYNINSGIMTLQKKYLDSLRKLAKELKKEFKEVLEDLKKLTEKRDEEELRKCLNNLEPAEWYMFKKVLRFPIPYFIEGLDDSTQKYIRRYACTPPKQPNKNVKINNARLQLKNININSHYEIADSPHVRAIRDCFGIDGNILNSKLVGPISIEASGGNILLITGPSGSGKTLLLKSIDPEFTASSLSIDIDNISSQNYSVAWLNEIDSRKPLIEYFSEKWGIDAAISALNQAGLSEAFIYLKPYKLLSRGQQYRARLSEISLGLEPVWLMDEFCADLDPFTAKIVANNLRKHVIRYKRIAIVAAANNIHYIEALRPNRVIALRQNTKANIMTYKEYKDEFCYEAG